MNRSQGSKAAADKAVHMLSFDVEEYFQVEAAEVPAAKWPSYASRLEPCVDRILQLLCDYQTRATFFVLGWVAKNHPHIVKRIAVAGHEIASHGMNHVMLGRLGANDFRRDLLESRKILEDISSQPITGFRAPTFSITHQTAWALDILAEAGFLYDSSVFPIRHDRYGVPDAPPVIHNAVGPEGGKVIEIPPLCLRVLGTNLPLGGGGYLRLLPVSFLGRAIASLHNNSPAMIYLHPWEFDSDQPKLPMSRLSRWRHRVNLRRTELKLRWLLRRFRFTSVGDYLSRVEGRSFDNYRYGLAGPETRTGREKSNLSTRAK